MNAIQRQSPFRSLLVWAALGFACATHVHVAAQSLYDESKFKALTDDRKAVAVGDVLTVVVIENASASANADTGTQRSNGISGNIVLSWPRARAANGEINVGGEFAGGGQTQREGRLAAQLSVTVRSVLPNGDLWVDGEQLVIINDERQRISLAGRVRTADISPGNVVPSTRIADVQITYAGEGHLAERQRPAWWRQVLDFLGL